MDFEVVDFIRMLSLVPQLLLTERTVSTMQGFDPLNFFSPRTCKTEFHYEGPRPVTHSFHLPCLTVCLRLI
jgi:hypothetical protein